MGGDSRGEWLDGCREGEIDNVNEEPQVLAARIWMDGRLVSRDADWPQPFKYRSFKDRGLYVHVTVEKPVKGLGGMGRCQVIVPSTLCTGTSKSSRAEV